MKLDSKLGRYILLCSFSFVLIMFGSRFVTLRFGQVFPEQSPAERNRITALETRLQALEQQRGELDAANARIAALEEDNKQLAQDIEAVKNVKPKIIYQRIEAPAPSASKVSRSAEKEPAAQPASEEVVHRGDAMEKVRRVFGKPQTVHDFTYTEQWDYAEYGRKSVTFRSGVVSEWKDMPVEP